MKLLWKICRILLKVAAVLLVLAILGFWTIRFAVWKGNVHTYYNEIELDDGPYVFWKGDSTIKVINFHYQEPAVKPSGVFDIIKATWTQELPASYTTSEFTIDLADSTDALKRIREEVGVAFDPYDEQEISGGEFQAEKIAAVGDVHGNYNHLIRLLKNSAIVDSDLNWIWGDGHLVFVGDVFDKGPSVTECLWLIYKLDKQAQAAGGMVHFLLGNHEMMVLTGSSDRYMRGRKYANISRELNVDFRTLYSNDSELGRWLRTKNTVVKINDKLFLHGGISENVVDRELTIQELNEYGRRLIDLGDRSVLIQDEQDVFEFLESFWGPYEYKGYVGFRGTVGKIASKVSDKTDDLSLNIRPEEIMTKILDFYGCRQAVVGHVQVGTISILRDGKVVAINMRLPRSDVVDEDSNAQMLLIEGDRLYRVRMAGEPERLN